MKFKIGDKVNFLNENGGGIVVKIIDNRLVQIETEDGFEMPVLATELIKDHRAEPAQEDFSFLSRTPETTNTQEKEEEPDNISEINPWGNIREEKGIYLAFEPHERQWVLTGDLDVHLINHTSNEILYSLFMKIDDHIEGIDFNSVPSDSKITIASIGRDEIENWINGYVQILFHNDLPSKVYYPLHSEIDLKINRFFKEGSYRSNTLTNGKAIIVNISPEAGLEIVTQNTDDRKYGSKTKAGLAEPVKDKPLIDKHNQGIGEAIVDLHIGELLDNILGLSSHDMLNTQIDYFKKTLESAMKNDYSKVTYIHGVGNGVLKNNIIKELENYTNTENQMASISKFGVGAIDVMISSNE
jgi:hypothetical protein